jgi:hypothetical protein
MSNKKGLTLFKDYLNKSSNAATSAPPMSIRASDLDDNFQRLIPLAPEGYGGKEFFKFTPFGLVPNVVNFQVCINGEIKTFAAIGFII